MDQVNTTPMQVDGLIIEISTKIVISLTDK